MTPPLTALAQITKAEAQAADAIREAARLIDSQAGSQLPGALAELAAACERAKKRVAEAQQQARDIVAGLLGALDGLTAETLDGVDHATLTPPYVAPAEVPAAIILDAEPALEVEAPAEVKEAAPEGKPTSKRKAPARKAAPASPLPAPLAELLPGGPPLLYETMVFDAPDGDERTRRYATADEARRGHREVTAEVAAATGERPLDPNTCG